MTHTPMEDCIRSCTHCSRMCVETAMHCLGMGGAHASPEHIGLMMDCSEICQTAAHFMLRNSPRHVLTCGTCAEVCEACARDCEELAKGDEMMLRCAAMCHDCAQLCRKMSMARA